MHPGTHTCKHVYTHYHQNKHHYTVQVAMQTHICLCTSKWASGLGPCHSHWPSSPHLPTLPAEALAQSPNLNLWTEKHHLPEVYHALLPQRSKNRLDYAWTYRCTFIIIIISIQFTCSFSSNFPTIHKKHFFFFNMTCHKKMTLTNG